MWGTVEPRQHVAQKLGWSRCLDAQEVTSRALDAAIARHLLCHRTSLEYVFFCYYLEFK